jgi:hypothetical protein
MNKVLSIFSAPFFYVFVITSYVIIELYYILSIQNISLFYGAEVDIVKLKNQSHLLISMGVAIIMYTFLRNKLQYMPHKKLTLNHIGLIFSLFLVTYFNADSLVSFIAKPGNQKDVVCFFERPGVIENIYSGDTQVFNKDKPVPMYYLKTALSIFSNVCKEQNVLKVRSNDGYLKYVMTRHEDLNKYIRLATVFFNNEAVIYETIYEKNRNDKKTLNSTLNETELELKHVMTKAFDRYNYAKNRPMHKFRKTALHAIHQESNIQKWSLRQPKNISELKEQIKISIGKAYRKCQRGDTCTLLLPIQSSAIYEAIVLSKSIYIFLILSALLLSINTVFFLFTISKTKLRVVLSLSLTFSVVSMAYTDYSVIYKSHSTNENATLLERYTLSFHSYLGKNVQFILNYTGYKTVFEIINKKEMSAITSKAMDNSLAQYQYTTPYYNSFIYHSTKMMLLNPGMDKSSIRERTERIIKYYKKNKNEYRLQLITDWYNRNIIVPITPESALLKIKKLLNEGVKIIV